MIVNLSNPSSPSRKSLKSRWPMIAASLGLLLIGSNAIAQSSAVEKQGISPSNPSPVTQALPSAKPLFYNLSRVSLAGHPPGDLFWVVTTMRERDDNGPRPPQETFKTLASPELRKWVSQLPPGSVIIVGFSYRAAPYPPPSLTAFFTEVKDFIKFGQSKKIAIDILANGF